MNTEDQTPLCTESTVRSSLVTNVHDLANSLNSISSTVQLLQIVLKDKPTSQELISELLVIMNDECRLMGSRLEALRRLA